MNDGRKVTLIDCLSPGTGSYFRGGYFADVQPHFVLIGTTHLEPSSACLSRLTFEIDDIATLFYVVQPDFPKPARISGKGHPRWLRSEVAQWMRKQQG
jgi:hypothetical protein